MKYCCNVMKTHIKKLKTIYIDNKNIYHMRLLAIDMYKNPRVGAMIPKYCPFCGKKIKVRK